MNAATTARTNNQSAAIALLAATSAKPVAQSPRDDSFAQALSQANQPAPKGEAGLFAARQQPAIQSTKPKRSNDDAATEADKSAPTRQPVETKAPSVPENEAATTDKAASNPAIKAKASDTEPKPEFNAAEVPTEAPLAPVEAAAVAETPAANIEPKPSHLAQYGVMGDVYTRHILGMASPRVAIMNVGGEEQKGTDDMRRARDLLRSQEDLNFVGFVEGRGVFDGEADVVITDGVVGNVMIKLAEGLSSGIFRALSREVLEVDPTLAARLEPVVKSLYAKHDYHEYGGAPLLGVNGICLISHGSSVARTITNAVLRSRTFVETGVNQAISTRLEHLEEELAA